MSIEAQPNPARPRVLLVHGIWNAKVWLAPFGMLLRAEGFVPELFGYDSVIGGPEPSTEKLITHLHRDPIELLVGHSLGGLVILEALRQVPELPVKRVVCLGAPLCGSRVATVLAGKTPLSLLLGRSSALLQQGCPAWQGQAQVGVVAGSRPHGVGTLLAELNEPSDGTVTVAETRLPGLADHCIVDTSHSGLAVSADAAKQTAKFLRDGLFAH